MTRGNLCIGGPWDGRWHTEPKPYFYVGVPKRGNQGVHRRHAPIPPTALVEDRIRYERQELRIDRNVVAVWLVEGMSFYDATLRLLENYKPETP